MIRKLILSFALLITALSANAQFEKNKKYVGASLTGLNLSYSGDTKFSMGLQAKAGYFIEDNFMLLAQLGYQLNGDELKNDFLQIGVGGRYYIESNGVFLGAGVNVEHAKSFTDFRPNLEVGYAFFINKTITIEPSIYYKQSFKSHSKYSTIGLNVGIGIYL